MLSTYISKINPISFKPLEGKCLKAIFKIL